MPLRRAFSKVGMGPFSPFKNSFSSAIMEAGGSMDFSLSPLVDSR